MSCRAISVAVRIEKHGYRWVHTSNPVTAIVISTVFLGAPIQMKGIHIGKYCSLYINGIVFDKGQVGYV